MSAAEDALAFALKANGIDGWEREHRFDRREVGCPSCTTGRVAGARPGTTRKCPTCRGQRIRTVGRKWALDFAFVPEKVGVEVNGGGWTRGRHHRPEGHAKDCEKLTAAQVQGWLVVLCTPEQVKSGEAVEWIEQALRQRREE